MKSYLVSTLVGVAFVGLLGCNAGKNRTNIELIQDMMDQPSLKAQDHDPKLDGPAMRVPPEGSIPRGYEPIPEDIGNDPEKAGRELDNPVANDFSPEILETGRENYRIYCGVCHGDNGVGKGPVASAMSLKPPSLVNERVSGFRDGRIFHVITKGYGVMGSYASQITDPETRWSIVNYVRTLQKKAK